jgi:aspartate aminotransferase
LNIKAQYDRLSSSTVNLNTLGMTMNTDQPQQAPDWSEQSSISNTAPLRLTGAAQATEASATLAMNEAVAARKAAGKETIHLGFGEASFPLHPLLQATLSEMAKETGYAPVLGIPALRKAIAEYLARTRGIITDPAYIAVGPGSKPLLYTLLHILQGDLLLPVPSWVSYAPHAKLAGRRVFGVQADESDHQRLSTQALTDALANARKVGGDPRILIVNTPSNPTGSMLERADAEAIALWCREEGITLICDEIYAELANGWREHISPALFYPEGTIVTGGISKSLSTGGWRLGYVALPVNDAGKSAMKALRAIASEIWSSASTPIQEASIIAFTPNTEIEEYVRRSARVHGYVAARLYETFQYLEVPCPRPAGAFYLYPDFGPWRDALATHGISTSEQLARYLLDEWDIAALPGSAFGEQPDALRLRLATSLLYTPTDAHTREEQDEALWKLLAKGDTLPLDDHEAPSSISLPMLGRAQERLKEFVRYLDKQD